MNASSKLGRRQLLKSAGIVGLGATLAACGSSAPAVLETQRQGRNQQLDLDILNFALNLEYLEAAFYLAAVGRLSELPGGDAAVILPANFSPVPFASDAIAQYADEIAGDELAHVKFLRAALGSAAVARPVLDLDRAFKTAAAAAFSTLPDGGASLPFGAEDFDPFANEAFFLHGAFIFEDVGVTAYKGAAKFLSDRGLLGAASSILAVEAYHAGEVRLLLYAADLRVADFYGGLPTWNIVQAISDARDALDGPEDLDQGVTVNNLNASSLMLQAHGGANIVPADENALAFSRSTQQVLSIVYLNSKIGTRRGGFFPEGLNGRINQVVPRPV